MCRQFGWALAYAPATLVMVWPGITEFATLPCWAQAQTGVSPERPWWSALNQAATWLIVLAIELIRSVRLIWRSAT